jgi:ATP-dependent Clp protease protease subunit
VEAIEKMLDRDTYMTGEEAKAFGLIDQVMERRPEPETPA